MAGQPNQGNTQMNSSGCPEIEQYADYRKFLKDFYDHAKRVKPYFSYRYFNRKAGIASPTLYSKVVMGERNLTEKTMAGFSRGLGLTERQSRFFVALVRFNQAKTAAAKQEYLEQMRSQLPRVQEKTLPLHIYEYYSLWHHIALRELACLVDWKGDAGLLSRSLVPEVPRKSVQDSIDFLQRAGLIRREPDGRYTQAWPHISTRSEVDSMAVREGNRQMGTLGVEALERIPPPQRDISSLTIGISRQEFSLVKAEIRYFKDRVRAILAGSEAPEVVYALNVQLFPLSRELPTGRTAGAAREAARPGKEASE